MTINELIKILKKYNSDLIVCTRKYYDGESAYDELIEDDIYVSELPMESEYKLLIG
jgi:hypothetical protein